MTDQKDYINIAFFINDKYACHCAVTMASILTSSNNEDFHKFYIVNTDLQEDSKRKLEKLKKIKNFEIEYVNFDRTLIKCVPPNVGVHISEETNCRLKTAYMLPNVNKVICMDCDLIVLKSLKELWDTDIKDYESACTLDLPHSSDEVKTKANLKNYFNSGVMLANLTKWREHDTEGKIFAGIEKYSKILRYPDQDSLNIGINENMKQLEYKYNVLAAFTDCYPQEVQQAGELDNPVVVHWAGATKPWNLPEIKYADAYWENARLTPFYEAILLQMMKFHTKHLENNMQTSLKVTNFRKFTPEKCKKIANLLIGKY